MTEIVYPHGQAIRVQTATLDDVVSGSTADKVVTADILKQAIQTLSTSGAVAPALLSTITISAPVAYAEILIPSSYKKLYLHFEWLSHNNGTATGISLGAYNGGTALGAMAALTGLGTFVQTTFISGGMYISRTPAGPVVKIVCTDHLGSGAKEAIYAPSAPGAFDRIRIGAQSGSLKQASLYLYGVL